MKQAEVYQREYALATVARSSEIGYYGSMTDEMFIALVAEGIDQIPEKFRKLMANVAITVETVARDEYADEVSIAHNETLLGLYQGVPQTQRGAHYGMVLPDKITIFKEPIIALGKTPEGIRALVVNTVWHEVAHHFGLDHDRIATAERRRSKESKKNSNVERTT